MKKILSLLLGLGALLVLDMPCQAQYKSYGTAHYSGYSHYTPSYYTPSYYSYYYSPYAYYPYACPSDSKADAKDKVDVKTIQAVLEALKAREKDDKKDDKKAETKLSDERLLTALREALRTPEVPKPEPAADRAAAQPPLSSDELKRLRELLQPK